MLRLSSAGERKGDPSQNDPGDRDGARRTFSEPAAVELAGFELDRNNMAERLVEKLDGDAESRCSHFCVR